ncbi:MAG: hypothetical protein ACXWDR_06530 [Actinomycetota bacterium]
MNGIHRNARIGYLVWGGLAALCIVLFMVTREQERAALTERVDAAERRALLYGDTVLHHALDARDVSTPLAGTAYRNLQAVVQDRVFDDPLVARVRLWSPDGTLLFSTAVSERGKIGRLRVNEDPAITAAAGGAVTSRLATVPFATSGGDAASTDLFETFVPLRVTDRTDVLGAVQIDQYFDAVRSAAAGPWRAVQWTCAGLAVLFGALSLRSFRRRSAEPVVTAPSSRPAAAPTVRTDTEEPARRTGEHEETIAASRAEHEETIVALRAEHEETITVLRVEHEETVAALKAELVEADAALTAELATSAVASAAAESDRLAETERRTAEAEDRAAEAERRATDLEVMLAAARREAQEAADEALAPPSTAASLEAQAFELLEARLIGAEDRAADAEHRLAELGFEGPPVRSNGQPTPASNGPRAVAAGADAPAERYPAELEASDGDHGDEGEPDGSPVFPISPEASELRARLARSAALKKRSIEG